MRKRTLQDEIDYTSRVTDEQFDKFVEIALVYLPEKERRIIQHRFEISGCTFMTLKELGSLFGVKQERIRQLERRTLRWLRLAFSKWTKNFDENDIEAIRNRERWMRQSSNL